MDADARTPGRPGPGSVCGAAVGPQDPAGNDTGLEVAAPSDADEQPDPAMECHVYGGAAAVRDLDPGPCGSAAGRLPSADASGSDADAAPDGGLAGSGGRDLEVEIHERGAG